MILHRLASAIRHQNWSQIITEILIVVIGIFLGLQVTDWNQSRLDRIEEKIHLTSLKIDMEASIELTTETISNKGNIKAALYNLAYLTVDDIDNIDKDRLNQDILTGLYKAHSFTYQMNAYENLKSSGHINLIEDNELRLLLTKIGSLVETRLRDETDLLSVQYQKIDPFLIDNFPMIQLAQYDDETLEISRQDVETTLDYKSFLLNKKTQNLIFFKFAANNIEITAMNEIKSNYLAASILINKRLQELSGGSP